MTCGEIGPGNGDDEEPATEIADVRCVGCGHQWVAVTTIGTNLRLIECPCCHAQQSEPYAIDEILEGDEWKHA